MFCLLAKGGQHPRGKSTIVVTGIGMEKAARLMYKANVDHLTSNSNYAAFRTASLRSLKYTAPYMHSGIFDSLEDVLEFYDDVDNGGGRRGRGNNDRNIHVSREQLDPLLRQLRGVDDDDFELLAFLEALSDDSFDRTIPKSVPSGLPVGGRIQ